MDTVVSVTLAGGDGARPAMDGAFGVIRELDARLSLYNPSSEICLVNANAGIAPVRVSPGTFSLIGSARAYAEMTGGAFDPTIGSLIKLWGIANADGSPPPAPGEIDKAAALVDYRQIELSPPDVVFLKKKGAILDLGGIGKGYASMKAAEYLRGRGIKSAMINLGGNIVVIGEKPGGGKWRIGVQTPWAGRGELACTLDVSDVSVITSGSYERFKTHGGSTLSHIFDPATGRPASGEILSATLVCGNPAMGDALATAIMVTGMERTLPLLDSLPDAEAIFIRSEGEAFKIYATAGLKGIVAPIGDGNAITFLPMK